MITIRQDLAWGFRRAKRILLLCTIHVSFFVAAQPRPGTDSPLREFQSFDARGGHTRVIDLKLAHLTTKEGLSQSSVTKILQDRRGFMWFATRDGLNRYDGNAFVVYKHNPNDPWSLSANFVWDLMEDDQCY